MQNVGLLRIKKCNFRNNQGGMSIIELMTVLFIVSLVSATVVSNIKDINRPLTNAGFEITHYLRLVRSRAVSQTLYLKVAPVSRFKLVAYSGTSCTLATTLLSNLTLSLPNDTNLISTSWSICFTPRGLSSASQIFQISDEESHTRSMQVALGGGVQIQ